MLAVLRGAVSSMGVQGALASMHAQRCVVHIVWCMYKHRARPRLLPLLERAGLLQCAAYVYHVQGDVDAALGCYAQLPAVQGCAVSPARLWDGSVEDSLLCTGRRVDGGGCTPCGHRTLWPSQHRHHTLNVSTSDTRTPFFPTSRAASTAPWALVPPPASMLRCCPTSPT